MDLQKADINDYALPLMRVEGMAKQIHDLCLEHRYGEARLVAQMLCVESRMLQQTLRIMEEKEQQRADPQKVHAG
jgi:hypothetical protein